MPSYPYGYGSSIENGGGGMGSSYPGLGTIGAYGMTQFGTPAAGPYSLMQPGSQPGYSNTHVVSPTVTPDPSSQAAIQFLNSVISGDKLPYGQDQQNALMSQASAQNAAAEAQQNQSAQDAAVQGGASATDPSLQSQYRQNAARRQTGNQKALGDIQSQAGSANFAAQGAAAGALLSHGERNSAMQQQQNEFNSQLGMAQNQQAQNLLGNYFGRSSGMQGLYTPGRGWGM